MSDTYPSVAEDGLVSRILSEADISARHGQYDRLIAIANEVAALRDERDAARAELAEIDARIYGAAGIHRRNYAAERDLRLARAEVAALRDERDAARAEVAALRDALRDALHSE